MLKQLKSSAPGKGDWERRNKVVDSRERSEENCLAVGQEHEQMSEHGWWRSTSDANDRLIIIVIIISIGMTRAHTHTHSLVFFSVSLFILPFPISFSTGVFIFSNPASINHFDAVQTKKWAKGKEVRGNKQTNGEMHSSDWWCSDKSRW